MIIVHHLNNSRSQRILWLLEELGLPYEIKRYQRDPKTMLAPATLLAVHPLGKSPVITEDGQTVAESGAIIEYLIDRHDAAGRLRPPSGSPDRLRYTYWLHYAEGSAMPPLLLKLIFDSLPKQPTPFLVKPIVRKIASGVIGSFVAPQLERHIDYWEAELADRDWVAGDTFCAADIQMSFPVEAAASRAGVDTRRPRLTDFLARIHARPAYARALQKGGPYSLL